jgi:hypothetical protein
MYRRSGSTGSSDVGDPYGQGSPRDRDPRGPPVRNHDDDRPSHGNDPNPSYNVGEEYYDRGDPDTRRGPPNDYPGWGDSGPRGRPLSDYPERGSLDRGGIPPNEYVEHGAPGPMGRPPNEYIERGSPDRGGIQIHDYPDRGAPRPRGIPPNDYPERGTSGIEGVPPNDYPKQGAPGSRGRPPNDYPERGALGRGVFPPHGYPEQGVPGPIGRPNDYLERGGPNGGGIPPYNYAERPKGRPPNDYPERGAPDRGGKPPNDYPPNGYPEQGDPGPRSRPPNAFPESGAPDRGGIPPKNYPERGDPGPRGRPLYDYPERGDQGRGDPHERGPRGSVPRGVSPVDAGYSSVLRGGHNDPADHDGYVGSRQSMTSRVNESVISDPRMLQLMNEDDDPTHHTRGGPQRARSPPRDRYPPQEPEPARRNLNERVQNYNRDNHNNPNGGGRSFGGGGGYPDRGFQSRPNSIAPPRISYYDDGPSYANDPRGPPPPARGMDDSAPRPAIQRVPSQSTISTSGFRSFYSDAYTLRGDRSTIQSEYRHNYEGPPPRDDYVNNSSPPMHSGASVESQSMMSYGGSTWDTRASMESRFAGGGGGYYGGPPPSRRGPPPPQPRDFSPHDRPPSRGPPPGHYQPPERPLIEVAPGLMMRLMGTDETMQAIQLGHITVTSCVVCGMDVHCHSASEYVLCPDCRVVSPVNQLDNAIDMTPQQGGLVGLGVKTEMMITMMEAAAGQY